MRGSGVVPLPAIDTVVDSPTVWLPVWFGVVQAMAASDMRQANAERPPHATSLSPGGRSSPAARRGGRGVVWHLTCCLVAVGLAAVATPVLAQRRPGPGERVRPPAAPVEPPIPGSKSRTPPAGAGVGAGAKGGGATAKTSGGKPPVTLISIELLTGADSANLKTYDWARQCQQLNVSCTIRRGREDDKPGITEQTQGTLRQLKIVGRIDRRGRAVFPEREFAPGEGEAFADWLAELKVYGAQGAPEGQIVWGLQPEQFASVYESLALPIAFPTEGVAVAELLGQFRLSPKHPLRQTAEATQRLKELGPEATCGQNVRGLSQGTGLALVLAEHGLGFRPRRNPDGSIDLALFVPGEGTNPWPVGWPRPRPPGEIAPSLFQFRDIHFAQVEVDAALAAGAEVSKVPVLLDSPSLRGKEIDLSQRGVDFPLKRTTWAQAYDRILGKADCKYEILIDEGGRPFVWVTTLQTPARRSPGG